MNDEQTRATRPPTQLDGEADVTRISSRPSDRATTSGSQPEASNSRSRSFGLSPASGSEQAEIQIGEILSFTWRIEALLAKGGMGAVYRARHVLLDSEHALKVILPEFAKDEDIVARMTREAMALHDISNDAVVKYEGFFLDEKRRRYLVMEYVDGPSLAAVLKDRRFTSDEVRALRTRLARGLAAAHDEGVLHRDISPDNIILPGGRIETAKIVDFGIAKSKRSSNHTMVGTGFIGKYSYASPEQFDEAIEPDGRSDIYSLGLVLAAAAIGNGSKLDMGNSLATAVRARQSVPGLDRIADELRDEIAAMLQPRPEDRPQSMRELVRGDADAAVASQVPWFSPIGTQASAGAEPVDDMPARRGSSHLRLAAVGTLGLLVAVAGAHVAYPGILLGVFGPDQTRIKTEVDRALDGFRCATLTAEVSPDYLFRTHVMISGFLPTRDDVAAVASRVGAVRTVSDVAVAIQVLEWPLCDAVNLAHGAADPPRVEGKRPDFMLKEDERYFFKVTVPKVAGFLYVDVIDNGGGDVLHLLPTPSKLENSVTPGQEIPVSSEEFGIGPPFGTQMVLAIVAKHQLFRSPRKLAENAASYLDALRGALQTVREQDGPDAIAATYRLFETSP
jgi:serine/threonine protein kinase